MRWLIIGLLLFIACTAGPVVAAAVGILGLIVWGIIDA